MIGWFYSESHEEDAKIHKEKAVTENKNRDMFLQPAESKSAQQVLLPTSPFAAYLLPADRAA